VGAAVGVGEGTEERVEALVKAGVDAIVVDTAHGHSKGVIERVRWVKQNYPQVDVIGGNIATGAAALALVEAGADAVKVGIGPAPSAPPASWRAWACRRSWPSTTWPRRSRAPACR
jgi:IMP dehydrogenase